MACFVCHIGVRHCNSLWSHCMLVWQKWLNKFRGFRTFYPNWSLHFPQYHFMSITKELYFLLPIQLKKNAPSIYIEILEHYIQECVHNGKIKLYYIPTNKQIADTFMKNLTWQHFEANWKMLQLIPYSMTQWIVRWSVEVWLCGLTYYSMTIGQVMTESHWWVTYCFALHYLSIQHIPISDTMIIHLHMVSYHIIIASYCTIVTP